PKQFEVWFSAWRCRISAASGGHKESTERILESKRPIAISRQGLRESHAGTKTPLHALHFLAETMASRTCVKSGSKTGDCEPCTTNNHILLKRQRDILTSRHYTLILAYMKMLTLRIPEELHKALKIKCVIEGVEMNTVVNKLIEDYVKENKPKAKSRT